MLPSNTLVAVESVESSAVVTVASFEFVTFQGNMSESSEDLGKRVGQGSSQKVVKKV